MSESAPSPAAENFFLRKILVFAEEIRSEAGHALPRPTRKVAVLAVVQNPCVGGAGHDLTPLYQIGRWAGAELSRRVLMHLHGDSIESYGKAVVVGVAGEIEHAAAIMHVAFVPAMRQVIASSSLVPCSKRVGPAGAEITVPLGHISDAWSPQHWDAIHLSVPDSPQEDELSIILGVATTGRPRFRVGDHRPSSARPSG